MNARRKLNQANINGALLLALVVGCMFQSLSAFIFAAFFFCRGRDVHARYSPQQSPRLSVPQFPITTTAEPPVKKPTGLIDEGPMCASLAFARDKCAHG